MKCVFLLAALISLGTLDSYAQAVQDEQAETSHKQYFVTLSDGTAVPDVNFEMKNSQGDKPVMVAESKNDGSEVARFYFFSNYQTKRSSCVGYDPRGKAFVIELKHNDDFRSGKDLLDLASEFIRPYTSGTIYSDVPLQFICSAAADGDPRAMAVLDNAARQSKGKLKKKLPSLKITGYDIRRDYWELEAHGRFNPFDFQIANLKEDFIKRQAKRFGYTQSADRESLLRRLEEGDQETIAFVSAHLTIDKRKKKR